MTPKRVLLLNQTFHPDVVATAQYLTILAEALVARGHDVAVIASRRAYDDPSLRFAKREGYNGITVHRVAGTAFGKGAKWRRVLDFGSFLIRAAVRVLVNPRVDVIVALTSPPLVAALAALRCRLTGERLVYWVMDLNPDEALAARWLRPGLLASALEQVSRFTLRTADAVVVLDQYMRDRVLAKGIRPALVHIVPPWSLDRHVYFDPAGRADFRARHGLTGRYVVMYSGNHSPVHPLDTLIAAAELLREDDRFCFLFVGGGSEFARLQVLAATRNLRNVKFLPYQPIDALSASLSAADLQVVVLGQEMVGTIHPSKLYNILATGVSMLSIGPAKSHIADAIERCGRTTTSLQIGFSDAEVLVNWLKENVLSWREEGRSYISEAVLEYSQAAILPQLVRIVEGQQPVASGSRLP